MPFLSVPVLSAAFPSGPERLPAGLRAETLSRWEGNEFEAGAAENSDRSQWVGWLLRELLDHGDRVVPGDRFIAAGPEASTSIAATFAVLDDPDNPNTSPARLLVLVQPAGTSPDGRAGDTWSATWTQRMALLCRTTGCRIGLVTDGDLLRFIWAPEKSSTGHATWRASLFSAERAHLDSLWTVFSARQFFAARADEQPEALLERSEAAEAEVTDTLGRQVRRAVELLIFSLDRAHRDPETPLVVDGLTPAFIYEGAVAVLMRLVFLLAAEENELLPTTNLLYSAQYAISTLRGDLEDAGRFGRERLEQQSSAWHRILATTRIVHGGVNHELLRINPYGGRLFDPDRYPFLEGRSAEDDTPWWADAGRPPLVDDLTVLEIMRALQVLQLSATDTRTLSYRNIEVEQIGHVYEGLLDHNAVSSGTATVLGLVGKEGEEPEVGLAELEAKALSGRQALITYLKGVTKRTPAALAALLDGEPEPQRVLALRTACGGNPTLVERVLPFIGVLRDDLRNIPMVFPPGAIYVTQTGSRRDTGTAYTTRSLAEELAEHALAPLCYSPGPQDTPDRGQWRVRSSEELLNLKVCDPAVGSGAILVAACRYLADALIEAWIDEGRLDAADLASASDNPARNEHRVRAVRLVAERCCYGVDRNPMAVDMAKMSFWLTTTAQDRPFTYLDHNIRAGDSLLGITDVDQLRALHLDPTFGRSRAIGFPGIDPAAAWTAIAPLVEEAVRLRLDIETSPSDTARDTAQKATLAERARQRVEVARAIADLLVGCALTTAGRNNAATALEDTLRANAQPVADLLAALDTADERQALHTLLAKAQALIDRDRPKDAPSRQPLHWPLVFPEVFTGEQPGFDACIGNPPFMKHRGIRGVAGANYRDYLVSWVAHRTGAADLVVYFLLRTSNLSRVFGLLATNTVGQGVSSRVGLTSLLDAGWRIFRAVSSEPWPGRKASVHISKVWATTAPWNAAPTLDGRPVRLIDEMLYPASRSGWRKQRLMENRHRAFQGTIVLGDGYFISEDDIARLIASDPTSRDVIAPLLNGEDVTESPTHAASRHTINFRDWDEAHARKYSECFDYLERHARPEVESARASYEGWGDRWWQHWRPRARLYNEISRLGHVLVVARVSKAFTPVLVDARQVFSDACVVFAYDDGFHLGLLASGIHWRWTLRFASTFKNDPRYTPTDVFETFPQPEWSDAVAQAGQALSDFRADYMIRTNSGLTDTYNRVHDSVETAPEILALRDLHLRLDYAVRDAYGWCDVLPDLGHGFHPVRNIGSRFTFAPNVADEVIDLLLEENKRRYDAEVELGLQGATRVRQRPSSAGRLFEDEDLDGESEEDDDEDEEQE
ncbi:MAG TPA: type IIL restriction-modification enzyme MmeI [Acidimicrobiales bacterium]|nr:type IIL restriction-modification enzyme MmeI [Acidimicrobiales bacterium]